MSALISASISGGDDGRHRFPEDVDVLVEQGLGGPLGSRHAVPLGHRGAPFVDRLGVNRRVWGSAVADVSALRHHGPALHHFYRLNRV